jgi:hypothetical protein
LARVLDISGGRRWRRIQAKLGGFNWTLTRSPSTTSMPVNEIHCVPIENGNLDEVAAERMKTSSVTGLGLFGAGLEFFALFFENRFPAELDFVAFERQDLDQNLIAFL